MSLAWGALLKQFGVTVLSPAPERRAEEHTGERETKSCHSEVTFHPCQRVIQSRPKGPAHPQEEEEDPEQGCGGRETGVTRNWAVLRKEHAKQEEGPKELVEENLHIRNYLENEKHLGHPKSQG